MNERFVLAVTHSSRDILFSNMSSSFAVSRQTVAESRQHCKVKAGRHQKDRYHSAHQWTLAACSAVVVSNEVGSHHTSAIASHAAGWNRCPKAKKRGGQTNSNRQNKCLNCTDYVRTPRRHISARTEVSVCRGGSCAGGFAVLRYWTNKDSVEHGHF